MLYVFAASQTRLEKNEGRRVEGRRITFQPRAAAFRCMKPGHNSEVVCCCKNMKIHSKNKNTARLAVSASNAYPNTQKAMMYRYFEHVDWLFQPGANQQKRRNHSKPVGMRQLAVSASILQTCTNRSHTNTKSNQWDGWMDGWMDGLLDGYADGSMEMDR